MELLFLPLCLRAEYMFACGDFPDGLASILLCSEIDRSSPFCGGLGWSSMLLISPRGSIGTKATSYAGVEGAIEKRKELADVHHNRPCVFRSFFMQVSGGGCKRKWKVLWHDEVNLNRNAPVVFISLNRSTPVHKRGLSVA